MWVEAYLLANDIQRVSEQEQAENPKEGTRGKNSGYRLAPKIDQSAQVRILEAADSGIAP